MLKRKGYQSQKKNMTKHMTSRQLHQLKEEIIFITIIKQAIDEIENKIVKKTL